jgi:hypothetical protein
MSTEDMKDTKEASSSLPSVELPSTVEKPKRRRRVKKEVVESKPPTTVIDKGEVKEVDPAPTPTPEPEFVKWIEPETTLPVTTGEVSIQIPYCIDRTIIPRRRFLTAIREMTAKQRFGFQVLLEGMKDEGTGLQMGGRVTNHVSAMRAMLERIADAVKGDCDG